MRTPVLIVLSTILSMCACNESLTTNETQMIQTDSHDKFNETSLNIASSKTQSGNVSSATLKATNLTETLKISTITAEKNTEEITTESNYPENITYYEDVIDYDTTAYIDYENTEAFSDSTITTQEETTLDSTTEFSTTEFSTTEATTTEPTTIKPSNFLQFY